MANTTATYAVEVSADASSKVIQTMQANLEGTIEVYFVSNFDLSIGESAVIIEYAQKAKTFAELKVFEGVQTNRAKRSEEKGNAAAEDYSLQYGQDNARIVHESDSAGELIQFSKILVLGLSSWLLFKHNTFGSIKFSFF